MYPKLGFFDYAVTFFLTLTSFKADTELHTKTDTELVTGRTAAKIGDLSPKFCFTCYGDERKRSHLGFNWSVEARNPKYILRYATGFVSRRDCGASCCLHIFPPKKETDITLNTDTVLTPNVNMLFLMKSKRNSALATDLRSDELKNCRGNRKKNSPVFIKSLWPDGAVKYINKHCIFALQSLFFPYLIFYIWKPF